MELLLFFLAAIGLTCIVVDGKIFLPIRNFFAADFWDSWHKHFKNNRHLWGLLIITFLAKRINDIITCHQCAGFWCGLFCGLLCDMNLLLAGFSGSFLSMFFALLMNLIEARTIITLDDEQQ